jgi:hypothetical protein
MGSVGLAGFLKIRLVAFGQGADRDGIVKCRNDMAISNLINVTLSDFCLIFGKNTLLIYLAKLRAKQHALWHLKVY